MGNQSASRLVATSLEHEDAAQAIIIILVGFMGAGKTTVGKELARLMGWPFEDLDDRIQTREGRTVEEIFRDSGESEFRRCEHVALRELLSESKSAFRVIAVGGGAFAQTENASLVQGRNTPTVFLDAPIEELFRRCQEQELNRPLRQSETHFRKLYESRRPLYMAATCRIETNGKPIAQIAAEVIQTLGFLPPK